MCDSFLPVMIAVPKLKENIEDKRIQVNNAATQKNSMKNMISP